MAESDPGSDETWLLLPDFETSHRIIHAGNWVTYAALGFEWLENVDYDTYWRGPIPQSQAGFGPYGLYSGDAWDSEARQPSDAPGVGRYVSPEGREYKAAKAREHEEYKRRRQADPDYDWWGELVQTNHNAIREDNWFEYAARGFVPVIDLPENYPAMYLLDRKNYYDGDTWDKGAGRPLRFKPGFGVYTSPEGLARRARAERLHRQYRRRLHATWFGDDTAAT
jgi:hypothetical protein